MKKSEKSNPRVHVISCMGVDFDGKMLPSFLRHYLDLGVQPECFHVILNAQSLESENLAAAVETLRTFGIEAAEKWIAPYTSATMWERRRSVQRLKTDVNDWIISADIDELHEYPASLRSIVRYCEKRGVNAIQGPFIDRLSEDGRLREIADDSPVELQYPVQADVICSIGRDGKNYGIGGTLKLMLYKGVLFPSIGGHGVQVEESGEARYLFDDVLYRYPYIKVPKIRFRFPFRVHHYKWEASLLPSLQRRLSTPGVSPAGLEYGTKLLNHIEQHGGISLEHVAVRKPGQLFSKLPWKLQVCLVRVYAKLKKRKLI